MDLQLFVDERAKYPWAKEPCLYCILQDAGLKQGDTFVQNNKFRCGTSGTKMFVDSDLAYKSGDSTSTGLISRCNLYLGFFRPFSGLILAALRVPKALVAESRDRISEDSFGHVYNVNRGSNTLALVREKEYHAELDRRGLRYQKNRELFETNNVENIISALRTVKGIEMYTFNKQGAIFDEKYKGGSRQEKITITETQPRQNPQRTTVTRAPSLTITLSKTFLQQLKAGNPLMFQRLINLVSEFDEQKKKTTTVKASKEVIQQLLRKEESDLGRQLLDAVVNQRPKRRSPRLAEMDDRTTEATLLTEEAPRRPRSARLARK